MKDKVAIIDLGSNSIRMHIVQINDNGGYRILESAREMVRLSEGLQQSGELQAQPIQRTLDALEYFKELLEVYQVDEVHALATAAVRNASNQEVFIEEIRQQSGLNFKILSGEEEAYYDYLGVVNTVASDNFVLMDIGGASTEFVWVEDRTMKASVSLPIGCIVLTEKFSHIQSKKKRNQAAMSYVDEQIETIPWIKEVRNLPIIGQGGTIRAMAMIDKQINAYPIKNLHNYHLTIGEVEQILDKILTTSDNKMTDIKGLSPKRADLMSMGAIALYRFIVLTEAQDLRVSAKGLRVGYFYELYFRKEEQHAIVEDVLEHSCDNLMKRFDVQEDHALHVQKLALSMFDQLVEVHGFNDVDRAVLEVASLLHDVGMHIGFEDHQIHGMYILLYTGINGLSIRDHLRVSFIVGNHRGCGLDKVRENYKSIFSKKEFSSIEALSLFLQIAEQLDRATTGKIKSIEVNIQKEIVEFELIAMKKPTLEMKGAMQFMESFNKAFGYEYSFRYKLSKG